MPLKPFFNKNLYTRICGTIKIISRPKRIVSRWCLVVEHIFIFLFGVSKLANLSSFACVDKKVNIVQIFAILVTPILKEKEISSFIKGED